MNPTQAQQLVEDYIEAYNSFDVDGMLAGLHEEVTFENVSQGAVTLRIEGKDALKAQAEQAIGWFMERNQRIKALRLQDNRAEADIAFFAITAVDLPNDLKAGTILEFSGHSVFTFRDEHIATIQDVS